MQALEKSILAIIVVVALLAAGCTGKDPTGTVKSFDKVPADAPNEVGEGDFRLTIQMVSEIDNGTPVPRSALLIYPIEKPVSPPSIHHLKQRPASYVARANDEGVVIAHLYAGKTYSFQATGDGHTEEFRHLKKMDRHLANPFNIVLFKTNLTVELTGTLKTTPKKPEKLPEPTVPGAGGINWGGYGPAQTWLQNISFHPIPEYKYNKEYVARLHEVKLTMTWENRPDAYGDLGVRAGFFDTNYMWEADDQTEGVGPSMESFTVPHRFLEPATLKKNPRFVAGPITRMPIVAEGGLPWKIVIEATFSTEADSTCSSYVGYRPECYDTRRVSEPGFELAFAAIAIGAGAWYLRRRR